MPLHKTRQYIWRHMNIRLTALLIQGADDYKEPELNYSYFPDADLFTSLITVNIAADLAIWFSLWSDKEVHKHVSLICESNCWTLEIQSARNVNFRLQIGVMCKTFTCDEGIWNLETQYRLEITTAMHTTSSRILPPALGGSCASRASRHFGLPVATTSTSTPVGFCARRDTAAHKTFQDRHEGGESDKPKMNPSLPGRHSRFPPSSRLSFQPHCFQ